MHEREDLRRDRLWRRRESRRAAGGGRRAATCARRESRRAAVGDVRNWLLVVVAVAVTALAYLALRTG